MKKPYSPPEMEIIHLRTEDIMTYSDNDVNAEDIIGSLNDSGN